MCNIFDANTQDSHLFKSCNLKLFHILPSQVGKRIQEIIFRSK